MMRRLLAIATIIVAATLCGVVHAQSTKKASSKRSKPGKNPTSLKSLLKAGPGPALLEPPAGRLIRDPFELEPKRVQNRHFVCTGGGRFIRRIKPACLPRDRQAKRAVCSNLTAVPRALARYESLTSLKLQGARLDLSLISKLARLESLEIRATSVIGLRELSRWKRLTDVVITVDRPVQLNLKELRSLTALETLVLDGVHVRRLKALVYLSNLRALALRDAGLSSLSGLERARLLVELDLSHNEQLERIRPLRGLDKLEQLDLSHTRVSDLGPLASSSQLTWLVLKNTKVSRLTALKRLSRLQQLSLSKTPVRDLTPLADLVELRKLELDETGVTDLGPLRRMRRLEELDIRETPVADLSPLGGLVSLQSLDARSTKVVELLPLESLPRLQRLFLDHSLVRDPTPLGAVASLRTLSLRATPIETIAGLERLVQLEVLNLTRTPKLSADKVEQFRRSHPCFKNNPATVMTRMGDGL